MDPSMIEKNVGISSKGTAHMTIVVHAVVLVLAISTTLVCGLRFISYTFGLDDWLVIVALVPPNTSRGHLKWFEVYFGAECSYLTVGAAVKVSLIVFIMRLFPTKFIRIAGISIMVLIAALTISMTLALALKCRLLSASHDKSIPDAKCWSSGTNFAVFMTQGVIMFVLDVMMPSKKRLMILGFAIPALVRFSTLAYAKDESNFTKSTATSLIWMEVKFNLALMSGSLSSLPKLFKRGPLRISSSSKTKSSKDSSATSQINGRSYQDWSHRISKKTEITRVFEKNHSQERIALIYGQGELMTTSEAYSGLERAKEGKGEVREGL
ncbi:hypothetical protein BDW62DRAFT_210563 [Aspergillus aurantiobrunneus]